MSFALGEQPDSASTAGVDRAQCVVITLDSAAALKSSAVIVAAALIAVMFLPAAVGSAAIVPLPEIVAVAAFEQIASYLGKSYIAVGSSCKDDIRA